MYVFFFLMQISMFQQAIWCSIPIIQSLSSYPSRIFLRPTHTHADPWTMNMLIVNHGYARNISGWRSAHEQLPAQILTSYGRCRCRGYGTSPWRRRRSSTLPRARQRRGAGGDRRWAASAWTTHRKRGRVDALNLKTAGLQHLAGAWTVESGLNAYAWRGRHEAEGLEREGDFRDEEGGGYVGASGDCGACATVDLGVGMGNGLGDRGMKKAILLGEWRKSNYTDAQIQEDRRRK